MIADLRERLATLPALDGKVFTGFAPQRDPATQDSLEPPYSVIYSLNASRVYSLTGFSGLTNETVQVSLFHNNKHVLRGIADIVRDSVEAWGRPEWNLVQGSFQTSRIADYEEDTKLFHISITFSVWHTY